MAERTYPLATPLGQPIPTEIIRPLGLIRCSFSATPSISIPIPPAADFLILRADFACYVQLGPAVITLPLLDGAHYPDLVIVESGEVLVIDHNAFTELSVMRAGAEDGVLHVQTVSKYTDVRKPGQIDRA